MTIPEQLEAHKGAMTLSGLAEILGVHYQTVLKWVQAGGLPAQKITGSYWIDPQLAARWWRDHEVIPKKPQRQRTQKGTAYVA